KAAETLAAKRKTLHRTWELLEVAHRAWVNRFPADLIEMLRANSNRLAAIDRALEAGEPLVEWASAYQELTARQAPLRNLSAYPTDGPLMAKLSDINTSLGGQLQACVTGGAGADNIAELLRQIDQERSRAVRDIAAAQRGRAQCEARLKPAS